MSEVWKFLTKPIFTFPAYTRILCVAVLVMILTAFVGYQLSVPLVYRYESSKQFESLGKNEAATLRSSVRILYQLEMSRILVPSKEANLRQNAEGIEDVRKKIPEDMRGVADLRRGMDYLALSSLEQERKDPEQAAMDLRSARAILKSLGWQDLSDEQLCALGDEEMKWKPK